MSTGLLDSRVPGTSAVVVVGGVVVVVVAGGDGRHSAWLAGWGVTRVVTQEITTPH